jgi:hypothetical protein
LLRILFYAQPRAEEKAAKRGTGRAAGRGEDEFFLLDYNRKMRHSIVENKKGSLGQLFLPYGNGEEACHYHGSPQAIFYLIGFECQKARPAVLDRPFDTRILMGKSFARRM